MLKAVFMLEPIRPGLKALLSMNLDVTYLRLKTIVVRKHGFWTFTDLPSRAPRGPWLRTNRGGVDEILMHRVQHSVGIARRPCRKEAIKHCAITSNQFG
jgi:hypothetical protein